MSTQLRRSQTGSAMVGVLFIGIFFLGIGAYAYITSQSAYKVSKMRENYSRALTTAEFASGLAIANLRNVTFAENQTDISTDWVGQQPFAGDLSQRRIGGNDGEHEYRVKIRSARQAYQNNMVGEGKPLGAGWLINPLTATEDPNSDMGLYVPYDTYEITAVARNINRAQGDKTLWPEAVVQTVVSLNSLDLLPKAVKNDDDPHSQGNTMISGEDHYATKYLGKTVSINSQELEKPQKMQSSDATFSNAEGNYWANGYLCLNYMVGASPNPYIPATRTFSRTDIDHRMMAKDFTLPRDRYFLGGKAQSSTGYTMTFENTATYPTNEEDNIWGKENGFPGGIAPTASPGGKFDVAVGKYEDLGRLYQNYYAGNVASADLYKYAAATDAERLVLFSQGQRNSLKNQYNSWKNGLRQNFVGMYATVKRSSSLSAAASPIDNSSTPASRHCFSRHYIKNSKGEILIRYYPNNSTADANANQWTGYYVWSNSGKSSSIPYGYRINGFDTRNENGRIIHARDFSWEEIQGNKLTKFNEARRYTKAGQPQRDSLGNTITPDNRPAKFDESTGKLVIGVPDFEKDGGGQNIPVGKNDVPNGAGGTESVDWFDESRQGNFTGGDSFILMCRAKGWIPVLERNPVTNMLEPRAYKTMSEFEFERNIAQAGDPEDVRKMTSFFMGLEDLAESASTPDFNYSDMVFTINVVPPVPGSTETVIEADEKNKSTQWWERDITEGLTGNDSQIALSTNSSGKSKQTIYEEMGLESSKDQIFTTMDSSGNLVGFPKALFGQVKGQPGYGLVMNPDYPSGNLFYSADQLDLFEIIALEQNPEDFLALTTDEARSNMAISIMKAKNPAYTFIDIKDRMDYITKVEATDGIVSAFELNKRRIKARQYASEVFGYQPASVPTAYAKASGALLRNGEMENAAAEPNNLPAPMQAVLGFLAGEMQHAPWTVDGVTHTDPWVPADGINIVGAVPFRSGFKAQPDGSAMEPRLISNVADCYVPFTGINASDPRGDLEKLKAYGMKEARYSIGFHRGGTELELMDSSGTPGMLMDHFELVLLAVPGFNPYKEAPATRSAGDPYFVASIMEQNGGVGEYVNKIGEKLKTGEEMPDFVFDKPIDGAGTLTVNGNLIIKDTFAYHGTIIVLGNLVVIPELKRNQLKYGQDGNPVDAEGNSLTLGSDGKYYYKNEMGVMVVATPVREDVYRGELVAQGNIMVSGKTETQMVHGEDGVPHIGKIDIRGSKQAIEETSAPWRQPKTNIQRLAWNNDDLIDTSALWSNTLNDE